MLCRRLVLILFSMLKSPEPCQRCLHLILVTHHQSNCLRRLIPVLISVYSCALEAWTLRFLCSSCLGKLATGSSTQKCQTNWLTYTEIYGIGKHKTFSPEICLCHNGQQRELGSSYHLLVLKLSEQVYPEIWAPSQNSEGVPAVRMPPHNLATILETAALNNTLRCMLSQELTRRSIGERNWTSSTVRLQRQSNNDKARKKIVKFALQQH